MVFTISRPLKVIKPNMDNSFAARYVHYHLQEN